jgi:hypothetical protein
MLQAHFISSNDRSAWERFLPARRSVFGSYGFLRVCEHFGKGSPYLYVLAQGDSAICYPMFLRPLAALPFTASIWGSWDSTTPEFTGPLLFGKDTELMREFSRMKDEAFRSRGVVAEFAHLHPWSRAAEILPTGIEFNREIVWVDLTLTPNQLLSMHLDSACRKNIKRAESAQVRVFAASDDQHLQEFCRIYHGTMQRNHALESYLFPFAYFRMLRDELPENARFVFAEYKGQIVSATLYLHDDQDVYSYLGGADVEFQQVRPTNAVVWDTICWGCQAGKRRLILGGGYKPEDGVFRFKTTFSKLRQRFSIYKRIHLEDDYRSLDRCCREYSATGDESIGYFPSYRLPCNSTPAPAAKKVSV